MKLKEVYNRLGIRTPHASISKLLMNDSQVLDLMEIWDGGPMEGCLLIQKNENKYILYEIVHLINANSDKVCKFELSNVDTIQGIANEIQEICNTRYEGTLNFDFTKITLNKEVMNFFGFYTYQITHIAEDSKWIFIDCVNEDSLMETLPFTDLLKHIARKWNENVWEGNISLAGDRRYKINNDPIDLIYQWDDLFGIVFEYDSRVNLDDVKAFISDNYNIY